MSNFKYFSLSGTPAQVNMPNIPEDAKAVAGQIDDTVVEGCLFNQIGWYTKPFFAEGLIKHESDELLVFVGGDVDNPEDLGAEIEIQLGNDIININNTCVVFVPSGVAHGNLNIKSLDRPVFYYVCHMNTGTYEVSEAESTEEKGKYLEYKVEGYKPVSGKMPGAPEGFLTLLLWLDGQKAPGAPYMETVWFRCVNNSGPAPHAHEDFDELIGFIGSDPNNPTDLGAEVQFDIDGELISVTESCIAYLPRGTMHSPILVPAMEKPVYHFSIGNGGDYVRKGDKGDTNIYVPK